MLAFSPNFSSTALEWQLEDNTSMINELCHDELISYPSKSNDQEASNNSTTSSPQPQEIHSKTDRPISVKRSIHNEYERDQRKKLNSLYSALQSLLPETDQRKKLSMPCTIARILKYIPELQNQIQRLTTKKEEMILRMSKEEQKHNSSSFITERQNFVAGPAISTTCLNRREVMVQICIKGRSDMIPLSKFVEVLEGEGLQLLNSATLATSDGIFYSLHLQAKDVIKMEWQSYSVYLISILKREVRVRSISC